MIFLASAPVFDVYRLLARNNKWSAWLQDVDKFVSPYHDSQVWFPYSSVFYCFPLQTIF